MMPAPDGSVPQDAWYREDPLAIQGNSSITKKLALVASMAMLMVVSGQAFA